MTAGAVAERLAGVLTRVEAAASKAGRHPLEIRLLAVTKGVPPARVAEGAAAGLTHFGENYVQEAAAKIEAVHALLKKPAEGPAWHLIGKLQRNKARAAVDLFEMIHAVDSLALAREIDRHAAARGAAPRILLEVNLAGEATKAGFTAKDAIAQAPAIAALPHVVLSGLMAIPPEAPDPEASRPHFQALRELRDEIRRRGLANESFRELSRGMSHDFEVAIEEGATWIRVGTAIFGERPAIKKRRA